MIVEDEYNELGLQDIVTKLLDNNLYFEKELSFEDLVSGTIEL